MVQFLVEMQSRKLAKTTLKSATLQGAAWDWVGILQVLEVRINQPGTKEAGLFLDILTIIRKDVFVQL